MESKLVISSYGSISPLGSTKEEVARNLFNDQTYIRKNVRGDWVGSLSLNAEEIINELIAENSKFKLLDRSVLLSIYASKMAWQGRVKKANIHPENAGVNIGSSRGSTQVFEDRHHDYIKNENSLPLPHTSPTTTLGAVSSWVGKELNLEGPAFSHSVTCSTSLYAIGNAMAWIKAGFSELFIAGGTEAPLTNFTIDQMRAMKIYSSSKEKYPCLAFGQKETNSMVLGEGAASFVIEREEDVISAGIQDYVLIEGIGFANEKINSPTSISSEGTALQKSMTLALKQNGGQGDIDLILAHAPGTLKGDLAELAAINKVFGEDPPHVFSLKWKTGHLLGASAALAIEQAILILKEGKCPRTPYETMAASIAPKKINKILINSIGFGGNAATIILSLKSEI